MKDKYFDAITKILIEFSDELGYQHGNTKHSDAFYMAKVKLNDLINKEMEGCVAHTK